MLLHFLRKNTFGEIMTSKGPVFTDISISKTEQIFARYYPLKYKIMQALACYISKNLLLNFTPN